MITRIFNILKILGNNKSILMLGPRGVGKTHLANQLLLERPDSMQIDLLKFKSYQRYLKEPGLLEEEVCQLLRKQDRLLVFIDEIQKVPPLLDEIHSLIEAHKGRLQFLLTGSSARKLKRGGANLLAGRALGVKLHPLTSEEIQPVFERILRLGSLPAIYSDENYPELYLKTYVETYLKEEILQEAIVRKVEAFSLFLEVAGQYHGRRVNLSEIAKIARVSSHTIQEYYQILEDTLLVFKLFGWSASTKKQLRTSAKYYIFDNGVANAIRGELDIELSPRTSRWGHLFEAWIIQEAFRMNDYYSLSLKFSYWETSSGSEVDLIVSRGLGQPLAAIEIKSDDAPELSKLKGLKAFALDYPNTPLYCFSTSPRAYSDHGITVLPWKEGLALLKTI